MNDLALYTLLRSTILTGLVANGYTDIDVAQDFQPTQQGADSGRAVYMHKLLDHRYGFTKRDDKWNATDSKMVHTELTKMETTFQISARALLNPDDLNAITAGDLANLVADILQSDIAILTLKAQNVQMYRVTEIRNPYIVNDYERSETAPSFDFTVTHDRTLISETPVLQSIEFDIKRV